MRRSLAGAQADREGHRCAQARAVATAMSERLGERLQEAEFVISLRR
jgi:hypothetical protein